MTNEQLAMLLYGLVDDLSEAINRDQIKLINTIESGNIDADNVDCYYLETDFIWKKMAGMVHVLTGNTMKIERVHESLDDGSHDIFKQ